MEIQKLRKKIDTIDDSIFKLLSTRMKCAEKMAKIKKKSKLSLHDLKREREIFLKIQKKYHKKLADSEIKSFLKVILANSKKRMKRS